MSQFKIFWACILFCFFVSCSAPRYVVEQPNYFLPVRGFSNKKKPYEGGLKLYGYVLLNPGGQDTALTRRNLNFTYQYLRNIPLESEFSKVKKSQFMITYWMLNDDINIYSEDVRKNLNKPSFLVANYNYDAAVKMLSAINKLSHQGPILVAWKDAFENLDGVTMNSYLYLDLSDYSPDDMNRAILLWRQMMSNPDADFQNAVIRFRESMRNLLQKYGGSLVDLISKK